MPPARKPIVAPNPVTDREPLMVKISRLMSLWPALVAGFILVAIAVRGEAAVSAYGPRLDALEIKRAEFGKRITVVETKVDDKFDTILHRLDYIQTRVDKLSDR